VLFSLCFLLFINAMSIGLVFPIFAPLFTESYAPLFQPGTALSTQTFYYSMILSIPTFCMVLGAPFWGRVSDRIGRKKVLLIGLTGLAASFIFSALGIAAGSLFILFASRALAGFMDGSEAIAQAAIVDLSLPHEKARNMGYATFAGTIGFIIGPIVGGVLAEPALTGKFHYEFPFIASLFLSLANAVALKIFLPDKLIVPTVPSRISYFKLLREGFVFCFDKRIKAFSLLLFILQWFLASYFQLSTVMLAERFHYSSGKIGLFTTFLGAIFSVAIFFVMHVLLKRLTYVTLLRTGICFIAFSILSCIYLKDSSLLAWFAVVPMMVGIAMMYNVLLVLISNAVTKTEQGEAMGSGTALKALAWLVAGIFISVTYPNLLALLLIMLCVAGIAFWITIAFVFEANH
jgi:DHA1 family tetracycline resistance protein-like MFS transporter